MFFAMIIASQPIFIAQNIIKQQFTGIVFPVNIRDLSLSIGLPWQKHCHPVWLQSSQLPSDAIPPPLPNLNLTEHRFRGAFHFC